MSEFTWRENVEDYLTAFWSKFKTYWFPHRVYRLEREQPNVTNTEGPTFTGPHWKRPRVFGTRR